MKPAHPGIHRTQRESSPRLDVFGEACVERGGECEVGALRPASCSHAQRSFSRDVQCVRLKGLDHANQRAARQQRQWNVAVGRAWDGAEPIGCNHLYHMTHGAQLCDNRGQRAYHTIHLRQPRICDDHDPVRGCWRQHLVAADQLVKDGMVRQRRAAAFGAARRTTVGWPPPNRSVQADRRDVPPARCSSPPSHRR